MADTLRLSEFVVARHPERRLLVFGTVGRFSGAIMIVAVDVAMTLPSSRDRVASRKLIWRPRLMTLASATWRPAAPWLR